MQSACFSQRDIPPNQESWWKEKKIRFTYSVHTSVNPGLTWATRMDHFMKTGNNEVHLMQLIISMLIVCSLGVLIAIILKRALGKDFASL
jgi:hypothetical protein